MTLKDTKKGENGGWLFTGCVRGVGESDIQPERFRVTLDRGGKPVGGEFTERRRRGQRIVGENQRGCGKFVYSLTC